jgi:hypothetical protein
MPNSYIHTRARLRAYVRVRIYVFIKKGNMHVYELNIKKKYLMVIVNIILVLMKMRLISNVVYFTISGLLKFL